MATVTAADPVTPSAVAVMVADPLATAVTRPLALTVATPGEEDDQENVLPEMTAPDADVAVAVSCAVWSLAVNVTDAGATDTDATVGVVGPVGPVGPEVSSPPEHESADALAARHQATARRTDREGSRTRWTPGNPRRRELTMVASGSGCVVTAPVAFVSRRRSGVYRRHAAAGAVRPPAASDASSRIGNIIAPSAGRPLGLRAAAPAGAERWRQRAACPRPELRADGRLAAPCPRPGRSS